MATPENGNAVEEEALAPRSYPPTLPLLTSSEVVIYPYMAAPLVIEDEEAIETVEVALKTGHKVVALFGRIQKETFELPERLLDPPGAL